MDISGWLAASVAVLVSAAVIGFDCDALGLFARPFVIATYYVLFPFGRLERPG